MSKNVKELLPIGSVVILKNGVRKLMITGIKTALKDAPSKIYDYIGVLYPEGFMGDKGNFLFDDDNINDIIFKGYNNPEREDFLEYLETEISNSQTEETIKS